MSTLTLTLTYSPYTAVNVAGNIVYGTSFTEKRLNQIVFPTADGAFAVYDGGGPTQGEGVIMMKNVSYTDGENLRTFIKSTIVFQLNTFTIGALAAVNWGKGRNTAITGARYNGGSSLKDVLEFVAPGIYIVKFPYIYT